MNNIRKMNLAFLAAAIVFASVPAAAASSSGDTSVPAAAVSSGDTSVPTAEVSTGDSSVNSDADSGKSSTETCPEQAESYVTVQINGKTVYLLAGTRDGASNTSEAAEASVDELDASTAAETFAYELDASTVEDNALTIWKFFRDKGFSDAGIAGIMGNLQAESAFLPNNLENRSNTKGSITDEAFTALVDNGTITREEFISSDTYGLYSYTVGETVYRTYGYGLAQWTFYSRKADLYDYWKSCGSASIADLTMQLNFIYKEMSSSLKTKMTEASDVAQATVDFHNIYEGSADDASRIAGRVANAQTLYNTYHSENPLKILASPTSKYRVEGAKATFTVSAQGDGLTYQWQYKKPGSTVWKNCSSAVSGYRSASMRVTAVGSRNGYRYRCVVTDQLGDTVKSSSAAIRVFYIRTQPSSVTKSVGTKAYFTVDAVSSHSLIYQWQYKKSGSSVWKDCSSAVSGYRSASMHVTAKTSKNGWSYRCVVKDDAGHTLTTTAVKLTVKQT